MYKEYIKIRNKVKREMVKSLQREQERISADCRSNQIQKDFGSMLTERLKLKPA